MKNSRDLQQLLYAIDGRGYPSYKDIRGQYRFEKHVLFIDHVQGDPFASPTRAHVAVSRREAGFPRELLNSKHKLIAAADFLTRAFRSNIRRFYNGVDGSGKSGVLNIDFCGQEILERTSVVIKDDIIEARFEVGLPAAGRRVLGKAADYIFSSALPKITENSLFYKSIDGERLKRHIDLFIDQQHLRSELSKRGLSAFIANGSILPRENGISDRPMPECAVPFKSPPGLEVEFVLPNMGSVKGMGIPEGISLIVGGGYHGKSTLLKALELGVYDHIPGDGRELVITRDDAVKIRAEDRRSVESVNISPFINNLPNKKDTVRFSTDNASGSTSQAANIMEALEAGSKLLLIDEDTSATNFMIRDRRMQRLVSADKEPITPFIDKARELYKQYNVSSILVVGGSGDYFDISHVVIMMDEYIPKDVTEAARSIAADDPDRRSPVGEARFGDITPRIPLKSGFRTGSRDSRIKPKGLHTLLYGDSQIDLSYVEQLTGSSQTNCIALMLEFMAAHILDDSLTLSAAADKLFELVERSGLDSISAHNSYPGNLAMPRKHELCSAVNRFRGLKVKL